MKTTTSRRFLLAVLLLTILLSSVTVVQAFSAARSLHPQGFKGIRRKQQQQHHLLLLRDVYPTYPKTRVNILPATSALFHSATTTTTTNKNAVRTSRGQKWIRRALLLSLMGVIAWVAFPMRSAAASTATAVLPEATTVATAANTMAAATATATTTTAATTTATTTAAATFIPTSPISRQTELRLSLRLFVAALLGGLVGQERSSGHEHHSAGIRTMSLVSMGAACFTICSLYGFVGRYDTSRMASNVASGVGFIGAGVITTTSVNAEEDECSNSMARDHNGKMSMVHGLTTAAAIWLSAAIGVSCGVGMFYLSAAAGMLTIGVLRFGSVTKRHKRQPSYMQNHIGGRFNKSKTTQQQQQQQPYQGFPQVVVEQPYHHPLSQYEYPEHPQVVSKRRQQNPYPPQQDPTKASTYSVTDWEEENWMTTKKNKGPPEVEINHPHAKDYPKGLFGEPPVEWEEQVVYRQRGRNETDSIAP